METNLTDYIVKKTKVFFSYLCIFFLALALTSNLSAKSLKNETKGQILNISDILSDRTLGSADATVTLIEYASMTCPHCAHFHNGAFQTIKKEYIDTGKVKFVYRDFPLDRLALAAAMMARCAPKDRYFAIVNIIYKTQKNWTNKPNPSQALSQLMRLSGVSRGIYDACISNRKIFDGVIEIRNDGEKKFDIKSTPTIIINDDKVASTLTIKNLRKIINAKLK